MSAWKIPLFALTLATLLGTAAYAQDDTAPADAPTAAASGMPATPAMLPPGGVSPAPMPAPMPGAMNGQMAAPQAPAGMATQETDQGASDEDKSAPQTYHRPSRKMTPEQREEMKRKHEERFKALPIEMQERIKRHRQTEQEARDKINNMPPEQRQGMQDDLVDWFKSLPLEKQSEIKNKMEGKKSSAKEARPAKKNEEKPAPTPAPVAEPTPAPTPAPVAEPTAAPTPAPAAPAPAAPASITEPVPAPAPIVEPTPPIPPVPPASPVPPPAAPMAQPVPPVAQPAPPAPGK